MNVSKLNVNGQEYNFTDTDAQSKIAGLQNGTYTKDQMDAELAKKVDSVTGKQLSTEDYSTDEKNKLNGIESGANNYSLPTASTSVKGGVKVGDGLSLDGETLSADKQIDWKTID